MACTGVWQGLDAPRRRREQCRIEHALPLPDGEGKVRRALWPMASAPGHSCLDAVHPAVRLRPSPTSLAVRTLRYLATTHATGHLTARDVSLNSSEPPPIATSSPPYIHSPSPQPPSSHAVVLRALPANNRPLRLRSPSCQPVHRPRRTHILGPHYQLSRRGVLRLRMLGPTDNRAVMLYSPRQLVARAMSCRPPLSLLSRLEFHRAAPGRTRARRLPPQALELPRPPAAPPIRLVSCGRMY